MSNAFLNMQVMNLKEFDFLMEYQSIMTIQEQIIMMKFLRWIIRIIGIAEQIVE